MPPVYLHTLIVPPDAIDANGHASNVAYIQWMQDAAVAHSAAQGWAQDRYETECITWVVRSHFIEYLTPSYAGERITIQTWVSTMSRIRSLRKYRFVREEDGAVLARAQTDWVLVDIHSQRPKAIPASVSEAFHVVPPEEEP